MKRRGFISVLVAVPLFGSWMARALGDEQPTLSPAAGLGDDDVARTLWGYLDHSSSWADTVECLRRYSDDGNADGEVVAGLAGLIESAIQRQPGEEPAGVLGLYPAVVLTLDALRAIRVHGAEADHRRQRELVAQLIEAA
jgi:hypothetical protein